MKEEFVDDKGAAKYRKKSLYAFIVFFALSLAAFACWKWLDTQPLVSGKNGGGLQTPLRNVLDANEKIYGKIYSDKHLVKEYPASMAAKKARVNGNLGLRTDNFDTAAWRLKIIKNNGDTLYVSLDEIRRLPKTEVIFNFKCIEGWSQITQWEGTRFSELIKKYGLDKEAGMKYVGLKTPDQEYYVGIDMPSVMHPQTLLCYELNYRPLPMNQGYPLRLIIPVKYGVKHLKRIGTISFANTRPPDYWAEKGYDYYTGL